MQRLARLRGSGAQAVPRTDIRKGERGRVTRDPRDTEEASKG